MNKKFKIIKIIILILFGIFFFSNGLLLLGGRNTWIIHSHFSIGSGIFFLSLLLFSLIVKKIIHFCICCKWKQLVIFIFFITVTTISILTISFFFISNMIEKSQHEAMTCVIKLFSDNNQKHELILEKNVKASFYKFSSNFDKSKITLLVSLPAYYRYEFIIDAQGNMPFLITLWNSNSCSEFWVHNSGINSFIKLYKEEKGAGSNL